MALPEDQRNIVLWGKMLLVDIDALFIARESLIFANFVVIL